MVHNKSLDQYKLIAALLRDVHTSHGAVFNCRALRNTLQKVKRRTHCEGTRFLTVALPRLGKAFDKALTSGTLKNVRSLGFKTQDLSELPMFMGEFFKRVFATDGSILPDPCVDSVRVIRQITLYNYKYEEPYTDEQSQHVIDQFEKTDRDCERVNAECNQIAHSLDNSDPHNRRHRKAVTKEEITREARILLSNLLAHFDPLDISPRHGPGTVATKQLPWDKYLFRNVSSRITDVYPLDAYFFASMGHVCDSLEANSFPDARESATSGGFETRNEVTPDDRTDSLDPRGPREAVRQSRPCINKALTYSISSILDITSQSLPARVILVPKDSRGPRLISCEPVDYQWVQQGLGRALVRHVEAHPLTREHVLFTNQEVNRWAALYGSATGKYATLDLKEASDRITTGLVSLLFPSHIYMCLDACRSLSTVLPDGRVLKLQKYAPMGSCLCFPVMALCIWAILSAAAPDADTRESILVYGDDVIVPTAFAESAMNILEVFGLRINRTKSCTQGSFRESCGVDAFKGVNVTPVRFRTVWDDTPRPDVYTSWIAYANHLFDKRCYSTYNYIVSKLEAIYGPIPGEDISQKRYPSLRCSSARSADFKRRSNVGLQKLQHKVRVEVPSSVIQVLPGWNMLLRFFVESRKPAKDTNEYRRAIWDAESSIAFAVSSYTKRNASILAWRWR